MTEFEDRIEGEIKTHEKEMLRKAVIHKYGDKPLRERINYVMSTYVKDNWTESELFDKLTELGLNGNDTLADVTKVFKDIIAKK